MTVGGSDSIMKGTVGNYELKVDLGKCFNRATAREIYNYFSGR